MEKQKTIGIVGGGQLAKNLTLAAIPLGFKVIVVEPKASCVAAQAGAECIDARVYDQAAIVELGKKCDYLTIETEHLESKALKQIAAEGRVKVRPSAETMKVIQDKLAQKEFFAKTGIPLAPFEKVTTKKDVINLLDKFSSPIMLKTRFGAYNGLGNALVRNKEELDQAWRKFAGAKLYVEKIIDFHKEIAVMAARDIKGNIVLHPVVETVHERNICQETLAPAKINKFTTQKIQKLAVKVVEALDDIGIFGIEMFLTKDGEVLINEVAPRVHNSGHYTLDGCYVSQFEQHIRAITGLPLGNTNLLAPSCVMINILGERDGPTQLVGLEKALAVPEVAVHIYGKSPTKIDRKMGHITATGKTMTEAQKRARQARQQLNI